MREWSRGEGVTREWSSGGEGVMRDCNEGLVEGEGVMREWSRGRGRE